MKKTIEIGFLLAACVLGESTAAANDPLVWGPETVLTQPPGGIVGPDVAIDVDGDWLVVGSAAATGAATDSGAAFVYRREFGVWSLHETLTASDGAKSDDFGYAVSISGDTLAIGAFRDDDLGVSSGSVYVYALVGSSWVEQAKLLAADGAAVDRFGFAVALDGDTLFVGAPRDDDLGTLSGSVYVFTDPGSGWSQTQKLLASDGRVRAEFGFSLDLDGDAALIGSPRYDPTPSIQTAHGKAYAFRRTAGVWAEEAGLVASDTDPSDRFGTDVGLSGDVAVVGAPLAEAGTPSNGNNDGAAYVFEYGGGVWNETAILRLSVFQQYAVFGTTVAVDGDTLLVGVPGLDVLEINEGGASLYRRVGQEWALLSTIPSSAPVPLQELGTGVALDGGTIGIAARTTVSPIGGAYAYDLMAAAGAETYCTAGTSASGCQALVQASGTPSATAASGFVLSVAGMEGAKNGLFFYGTNGRQANAWGSGTSFVCVVPPRVRGNLLVAFGTTAGECNGWLAEDLNARWCPTCPKASHNPGSGAIMQAQLWYRDPQNTSNQSSSMSDAVEFTFVP